VFVEQDNGRSSKIKRKRGKGSPKIERYKKINSRGKRGMRKRGKHRHGRKKEIK